MDAAVSNLEQAHALAPESTVILVDLIVNAMRANRPGVAVDAANKLLQLKPDDPESQYLFGAASLQNGSLRSAQTSLERYRQQRPDDVRGCLALGIPLPDRVVNPAGWINSSSASNWTQRIRK